MPLATGVQVPSCIERLDLLAYGCEFGGVWGGCKLSVLRATAPFVANICRGAHYFYTDCIQLAKPSLSPLALQAVPCSVVGLTSLHPPY